LTSSVAPVMKVARSEAKENRVLVSALTDGGVPNLGARAVTLSVTDQARRLARAMTWFTLGMEAILALLVLVPWASARLAAVLSVVRSE